MKGWATPINHCVHIPGKVPSRRARPCRAPAISPILRSAFDHPVRGTGRSSAQSSWPSRDHRELTSIIGEFGHEACAHAATSELSCAAGRATRAGRTYAVQRSCSTGQTTSRTYRPRLTVARATFERAPRPEVWALGRDGGTSSLIRGDGTELDTRAPAPTAPVDGHGVAFWPAPR